MATLAYPDQYDQQRSDGSAAAHRKPPNPTRGGGLFVAGLLLTVVSAGVGAFTALALQPHTSTLSALAAAAAAPRAETSLKPGTVEEVAARVLPSVVQLETDLADQSEQGSGIVLTSDGLIMTNAHVVADSTDADGVDSMVTFSDGSTAPFAVVAADPASDVAVVQAKGVSGLTPIALGASDDLRVGQQVVAVGSPLGLEGTVTTGVISALNRPVTTGPNPSTPGTTLDTIQTDAPINPGNSGGALVDADGRLIGMNSALATLGGSPDAESGSIGLGFAIPVDQAKRIADELVATGTASHATLGVQASDDEVHGAKILDVTSGGPAAAAGLSAGAVVVTVDDQVIEDADALAAAVQSKAPGNLVTVGYLDSTGVTRSAHVVLGTDGNDQP
ncbi:PDZ domain-containing protein [Mycolicibacterium sp. P9-64]|uniref:S1C family serine protease n=1 Tax=Mycolicibacterium sp. P9-64 TaxID=2024612 RepID=UPI0011F02521|nr:trypsin-like peptidase domain-containing protein [Mycolicibacterium sp. P9-64]KAA0082639.1 PDZ domain-containing protein [Mycolicibacterium sp. P9-64]